MVVLLRSSAMGTKSLQLDLNGNIVIVELSENAN